MHTLNRSTSGRSGIAPKKDVQCDSAFYSGPLSQKVAAILRVGHGRAVFPFMPAKKPRSSKHVRVDESPYDYDAPGALTRQQRVERLERLIQVFQISLSVSHQSSELGTCRTCRTTCSLTRRRLSI